MVYSAPGTLPLDIFCTAYPHKRIHRSHVPLTTPLFYVIRIITDIILIIKEIGKMEEKKFFTPKEAAAYLSNKAGREINVNRLSQLRRKGKVKATQIGYNETIYMLEDLEQADVSLGKAGRKPKSEH